MIAGLFDHLWQSSVFALAAGLMTLALRGNGAHLRYWLWFAASAKFLFPFSLLVALGTRLAPAAASVAAPLPFAATVRQVAQPFALATPVLAEAAPQLDLRPILFAVWALGFAAVLALRLVRWGRVHRAVAEARPLALAAPIPVKSAPSHLEPGLVGLWRPVLLMPEGIAEHLAPEEMTAVVSHELCHLRRGDNLTAAIHMVVEGLFWFYPPVWWLGARLIDERERACDEAVVGGGADPQVYAEGILKVCKFYLQSPLACAAGVSGSNLSNRMESIMSPTALSRLSAPKKLLLAAFAVAALAAPVASGAASAANGQGAGAAAAPTPDEIAQRRYEQARPRKAVPFEPARFDRYVGFYEAGPNAVLTVTRQGEHFIAQLTGQPAVEIYPESDSKFFYTVVPAQVSFVAGPGGSASELVLHQGGFEQHARRIDERTAKALEAARAEHIRSNRPSPGSKQALRKLFTTLETSGVPNYADMTPALAGAFRQQLPALKAMMQTWGPLKSITFERVGPGGNDQYEVAFANGKATWVLGPLSADGKMTAAGMPPGS